MSIFKPVYIVWALEWASKGALASCAGGNGFVCHQIGTGLPILFETRTKAIAYLKEHPERFKTAWSINNMRQPRPVKVSVTRT